MTLPDLFVCTVAGNQICVWQVVSMILLQQAWWCHQASVPERVILHLEIITTVTNGKSSLELANEQPCCLEVFGDTVNTRYFKSNATQVNANKCKFNSTGATIQF